MTEPSLNPAARQVLARYAVPSGSLHLLRNAGGFSGACLWRLETAAGSFCLRAWPPGDPDPERLAWLHGLMAQARAAGLAFVPHIVPAGLTPFTAAEGRLWDLTTWLPGQADFHQQPTPARLRAAATALARLHQVWAGSTATHGPCPALARRQRTAQAWAALVSAGRRPCIPAGDDDPVHPWARQAWSLAATWIPCLADLLAPWVERPFLLHPCLCDIWHDHVLFDGDAVSGIVDYGSVKNDHAAVDLARLVGSLVGDEVAGWETALTAYAAVRPISADERVLARILDRTGTVLGLVNWLKWLYHDGRTFDDRRLVAQHLAGLVQRVGAWR